MGKSSKSMKYPFMCILTKNSIIIYSYILQVYTVNQESRYLLIFNVPALGVIKDLLELFAIYGEIEE